MTWHQITVTTDEETAPKIAAYLEKQARRLGRAITKPNIAPYIVELQRAPTFS